MSSVEENIRDININNRKLLILYSKFNLYNKYIIKTKNVTFIIL